MSARAGARRGLAHGACALFVACLLTACERSTPAVEHSAAAPVGAPAADGSTVLESGPGPVREPAGDRAGLERARARWARLTADERRTIAARYEEFQRLGPTEQQDLAVRARRMREATVRVQSALPAEVRERLRALEPEKRREAMREIVGDEAREKGQAIRAKLPDAWLARLEEARPEQRPAILAQFRDKHLKRIADFAIERTGASLGLEAAELQQLKQLPLEERTAAVLDLRKRAIEKDASENGLPPGMTAADWTELVQLSPQDFFVRAQEYRKQRVEDEEARRAAAGAGNPDDPNALPPVRREGLQRLMEAVQQRPDDVIALVDLPKEERRQKLFEIRRQRCLEILRAYHLVPPQRMNELETLGEKRFHEVLRHVLQPLRRMQARGDGWPLAPRSDGERAPGVFPPPRPGGG